MNTALELLLGGSIDYAGIFPPAALSLEQAAKNYSSYLNGSEEWILNRFVCPVGRLSELLPLIPECGPSWSISALGTHITAVKEDVKLIHAFSNAVAERAAVECYEVRASEKVTSSIAKSLPIQDFDACYVEIPWGAEMKESLHALAQVEGVGAKARTGGDSASAFPSAIDLAEFLKECIDLDLAFKLTAGLHHALPQKDTVTGGQMHGFLNVFVAGALAGEYDLSAKEIERILVKHDRRAFVIYGETIEFEEMEIDEEAIEDFRMLFESFGSCSVAEPLAELESAGLIITGAVA